MAEVDQAAPRLLMARRDGRARPVDQGAARQPDEAAAQPHVAGAVMTPPIDLRPPVGVDPGYWQEHVLTKMAEFRERVRPSPEEIAARLRRLQQDPAFQAAGREINEALEKEPVLAHLLRVHHREFLKANPRLRKAWRLAFPPKPA